MATTLTAIAFIHAPTGGKIIEQQFTPYFNNLKPLAHEWRALVKIEDDRRVAIPKPHEADKPKPLTHQKIIELIRSYADDLPDSGDPPESHPDASRLKREAPSFSTLRSTVSAKKTRYNGRI